MIEVDATVYDAHLDALACVTKIVLRDIGAGHGECRIESEVFTLRLLHLRHRHSQDRVDGPDLTELAEFADARFVDLDGETVPERVEGVMLIKVDTGPLSLSTEGILLL